MRLDRYVAHALGISRSDAQALIKNRKVHLNQGLCTTIDRKIEEKDNISVNNEPVINETYHYIMLHKPKGYISATTDKKHKTILDLIETNTPLAPIGRLDIDTEGLVILTNHGSLIHYLTAPKSLIWKTYYVKTLEPMNEGYIPRFQEGFDLYDGKKKLYHSEPAKLEIKNSFEAFVHIHEGKYHQIKKMFFAMKNEVIYLQRIAMGPIQLDPSLKVGDYRALKAEEISNLLSLMKKR
ncbi:MAG: 16S rRNA pseudouridine(516) synthase [Bacilli bacterium]|nr:16S rRNA pseudouridine(516) synthase [Bacilli bacterium]